MKFIKLTLQDGTQSRINMDLIEDYNKDPDTTGTLLRQNGEVFAVKESIEAIDKFVAPYNPGSWN